MKPTTLLLTLATVLMLPGIVMAQSGDMNMKDMPMDNMQGMAMPKQSVGTTYKATGTVKKIDAANGMVTLEHEAVPGLNWPAMTMSFGVADKKQLNNIKPGMKVKFEFKEGTKGKYVITELKG